MANEQGTNKTDTIQYFVSVNTARVSNRSNKENQKAVTMIHESINTEMRRFVVRLASNKTLNILFNSI